jgi:predicted methyltransferase
MMPLDARVRSYPQVAQCLRCVGCLELAAVSRVTRQSSAMQGEFVMTRVLRLRSSATFAAVIGFAAFASIAAAKSPGIPKYVAAAVADPARPQADRDRDADRKPAECIAFAGLKPGQRIADLLPGGGYFTRIFSGVVGPKGEVIAVAPPKRPDAPADRPEPAAAVRAISADPHYSNVNVSVEKLAELKLPEKLDMVWTSLNYHDVHNVQDIDVGAFNKAVLASLKPGGIYMVIDHATEKGAGFSATSTLHRSDPEAVKAEVMAAGFEFVGASDVIANSTDDHSKRVFEQGMHDKTDRFVLKFRKPK